MYVLFNLKLFIVFFMKIYQAGFCCVKLLYLGVANTQFIPHKILFTLPVTFMGNVEQADHSYIEINMCTHQSLLFSYP